MDKLKTVALMALMLTCLPKALAVAATCEGILLNADHQLSASAAKKLCKSLPANEKPVGGRYAAKGVFCVRDYLTHVPSSRAPEAVAFCGGLEDTKCEGLLLAEAKKMAPAEAARYCDQIRAYKRHANWHYPDSLLCVRGYLINVPRANIAEAVEGCTQGVDSDCPSVLKFLDESLSTSSAVASCKKGVDALCVRAAKVKSPALAMSEAMASCIWSGAR